MNLLRKAAGPVLILTTLIACATAPTTISDSWRAPDYARGKLKKALVVVMADRAGNRYLFENNLVEMFQSNGVAAVPSAAILPQDQKIDKASVTAAIDGADIDSVFVARLIELKKEEVYTPPQVTQLPHGYLGAVGHPPMIADPGFYSTQVTVRLESALYETVGGTVIWSAVSETLNPDSAEQMLNSYRPAIEKELKKNGFL